MPRRKRHIKQSPKQPAEVRRRQLLRAAEKLFQKKGYRTTTVDDIARSAGLTKGAVYYHFRSKEDILLGIVKEITHKFLSGLEALPGERLSPVDFLRVLQSIEEEKGIPEIRHNLDFRSQAIKIPRIRSHVRQMFDRGIEVFSERIDPRFARTAEERRHLAVFIYCLYDGLAMRRASDPGLVDLAAQTRLFESFVQSHKKVRNKGK